MSRSTLTRLRALPAALIVVAILAGACTDDAGDRRAAGTVPTTLAPLAELSADEDSSPTVPLPPGFVPPDNRGAPLLALPEPLAGDLPPIEVLGGEGRLSGRVQDLDGQPVAGATVRLERFVEERGGFIDVATNDDGLYEAVGLLGGKYRVRAWQKPNLATVSPQTTFLEAKGELAIDVSVEKFEGKRLSAAIVVPEPEVGVATFFDALLVEKEVDDDGIVRGKPIPDAEVSVLPVEGVRIDSDNPAKTNADGKATFVLMCLTTGEHTVAVFAQEEQFAYTVPACKPGTGPVPPPPTTVSPNAPTTTVPNPQFAIGKMFAPPFAGPLPAGTYTASTGGASCLTAYEVFTTGRWIATYTTGPTIRLLAPGRSFRAVGSTKPCTFTRVK